MGRIYGLIIGYLFGNIQARYLYKKLKHKYYNDYKGREKKAVINHILWKTAGIIACIIDCLKVVIAYELVSHQIVEYFKVSLDVDIMLRYYTCFGAILGHYYPFYLKFKGDKGIAAYWGVILAFRIDEVLVFFCIVAFLGEMYVTKRFSRALLKSIIVFNIGYVIGCYFGQWATIRSELKMIEASIIIIIISVLAYINHKSDVREKMQKEALN